MLEYWRSAAGFCRRSRRVLIPGDADALYANDGGEPKLSRFICHLTRERHMSEVSDSTVESTDTQTMSGSEHIVEPAVAQTASATPAATDALSLGLPERSAEELARMPHDPDAVRRAFETGEDPYRT
jgi:hypothetical protein